MTPASLTGWTTGPNMPNSFVWDSTANILYFYQKGYRNFIFFTRLGNIIQKTKQKFWTSDIAGKSPTQNSIKLRFNLRICPTT